MLTTFLKNKQTSGVREDHMYQIVCFFANWTMLKNTRFGACGLPNYVDYIFARKQTQLDSNSFSGSGSESARLDD